DHFDVQRGKDIWEELSERDLPGTSSIALVPLGIPMCHHCSNPMEDVLLACITCKKHFCYESPDLQLGRMCVSLYQFASPPSTPFEEWTKSFVCPECYTHEEGKLYPVSIAS
ncbi:hypothetical protein RhiTH_011307, partial [Rhizoctonia solani]